MGCIAQLVNCLQSLFLATGDRCLCTPNYHVFAIYAAHQGARSVPLYVEAAPVRYADARGDQTLWGLAGSASRRGDTLTLTVVNPRLGVDVEAAINLAGGAVKSGRETVLTHADPAAHNTFDAPGEVAPREAPLDVAGATIRHRFQAQSVTKLTLDLV